MAGGDAKDHAAEAPPPRPVDPFLRFLIPAPKPRPTALTRTEPPHRLIAPRAPVPALLRHDERLFIVPPTRPDWLPPPRPRPPVPPPPPPHPSRRYHSPPWPGAAARPRPPTNDPRARNAARFAGAHVNGPRGRSPLDGGPRSLPAFLPAPHPHEGGCLQWPRGAGGARPPPHKEKKAWVAVQRKAEGEDRAALCEAHSRGDEGGVGEAEDQPQPECEGEREQRQEDDGDRRLLLMDQQDDEKEDDDVKRSLPTDGTQATPPPNRVPRLQGRTRRSPAERRRDMDAFAPGFLAVYESLKPSGEQRSKQEQLVDSLARSVRKECPHAQMHLYGSCANSFGTSHSDVDVCLEMETGTESAVEVLVRLADVLRTDGFENVEVNPSLQFCN
jgi:predicted nucleotidyltransferase